MAFRPLREVPTRDLKRAVLANAVGSSALTITIGDAIQPGATGNNSYVTDAATSGLVLGTVAAVVRSGIVVSEKNSVTGSNTAYASAPNTAVTQNDNQTYKIWAVDYVPSNIPVEYEADLSQAAGTTTNSGGLCFLNLASGAATLDETSVALFGGTAGQFWSYGVTAYSTTKVIGHWYKVL